jgi:release factor glutamine methyltransferase
VISTASSADHGELRDARNALRWGISQLVASNVTSPALAAELLLMHVFSCDRAWLYAHPEHSLTHSQASAYRALLAQRAAGTPTQYLTGRQEFWGLEFAVTPAVLIPRPETEHVVEVALERLGKRRAELLRVADVGTGSGCLAVALARELPRARIVATDISPAALGLARENAQRHDVAQQIEFLPMSLLGSYLVGSTPPEPRFDLVVSNPPYVAHGEAAELPREVREHEPATALFAGETGMEIYAQLIPQATALVRLGGCLVIELGYQSAEAVRALVQALPGWTNLAITNDLAGIPRVLAADRV